MRNVVSAVAVAFGLVTVGIGPSVPAITVSPASAASGRAVSQRLDVQPQAGDAPGPRSVTGGGSHFCAMTGVGGVKCWIYNVDGELGDGTSIDRLTPVDVSGLTSGAAGVSAGGQSTCAMTTDGGAKCWGNGHQGQLGNGSLSGSLTPVDVSGLTSGVAAVSAGYYHACALTTAGGVKCWGDNTHGGLGDGTTSGSATPVEVSGLSSGVESIATGLDHSLHGHSCALTTAGAVKCWGDNQFGELGDGTTTDRLTPVAVSGLTSGVAALFAGGTATCAVMTTGGAKCWGHNDAGQLGDGTTTDRSTPVDVMGLSSGVSTMALSQSSADEAIGSSHTCAVTTAGGVKCWGYNGQGQLGDGTTGDNRLTPTDVSGLNAGMVGVGVTFWSGCAISAAGGMKCWGSEVGDGTTNARPTPVDISGSFFRPECPTVIAAPHTTFTLADGYAVGSVAMFAPDAGFRLVGSPTSTCRSDLTWSTPVPTATATVGEQSITFGPLANRLYGAAPFTVSASATSGLPVSFASLTPAVCTVSASTATIEAVGLCTIRASQAGNSEWSAASPVDASFTVLYGFGGFLSPRGLASVALPGAEIHVDFRLTNAAGQPIPARLAAAFGAAGNVEVTLSGPGIQPRSERCDWRPGTRLFRCDIKVPKGVRTGSANPYTITAYENVGTGFIVAPPVGGATNPETIFFRRPARLLVATAF
jgi:alpha-tubulin suppressor-like RCC1 family protein